MGGNWTLPGAAVEAGEAAEHGHREDQPVDCHHKLVGSWRPILRHPIAGTGGFSDAMSPPIQGTHARCNQEDEETVLHGAMMR